VKESASAAVQAAMDEANDAGVTDAEIVTMVCDLYQLEAGDTSLTGSESRASAAGAAGGPPADPASRRGRGQGDGKARQQ
jgi:hypothetical protein